QGGLLIDALTNGLRKLLSTYCQQFNQCNQRSGNLFRAKTKAKDLTAQQLAGAGTKTDYYINCFYYIHQNPLRHQLVTDINQWKYSSYRFYARQRRNDFCNQQLAAEICAYAPDSFVNLVSQRLPPSTPGNLHAG
ncbi:MAG TPA: hypothetical protein VL307_02700, partial [Chitinophagaceae bacterium]|nr:hypothetical protein [Chitinophagaceae bacterium]